MPDRHARASARSSRTGGGSWEKLTVPPPSSLGPAAHRRPRRLYRPRFWGQAWLTLCSVAAALMVIALAVDRAISAVLPPDSEHLAAARQTIDQRLARALTDCETLITIAGAPAEADFRQQFGSAVARVHGLVGEVVPLAEPTRSSMLIRVWRAFRSQRS